MFRTHVRATVFLALFAGLAGGTVLASVAASLRGSTTYDRFVERSEPADLVVATCPPGIDEVAVNEQGGTAPCYGDEHTATTRDVLAAMPGVERVRRGALAVVAAKTPETTSGWRPTLGVVEIDQTDGVVLGRPMVLRGRLADDSRADEVVIDQALANVGGYDVGDHVTVRPFTADQLDVVADVDAVPAGPDSDLTIVGIIRLPDDLQPSHPSVDLPGAEARATHFYLTPAWWMAYGPNVASYILGSLVVLDDTIGAQQFDAAVTAEFPGQLAVTDEIFVDSAPVIEVIDLQSTSVLLVGVVIAIAGIMFVGQAMVRQIDRELPARGTLHALGLTGRDLSLSTVARHLPTAIGAAVVAVVFAIGLSPLTPVGLGRDAEVDPGLQAAPGVLAIGAVAIVAVVVCLAWLGASLARRAAARRRQHRRGILGKGRGPVTAQAGMLLVRSRGSATAVGCAALAVASVTGAGALLVDMDRLEDEPARYGVTWDYAVGNYTLEESWAAGVKEAKALPFVVATGGIYSTNLEVAGETTPLMAFHDSTETPIEPIVLDGRAPVEDDEVALGATTMRELDVEIGDDIEALVQDAEPLTVVGTVILNDNQAEAVNPGRGALVTPRRFDQIVGIDVDMAPVEVLLRVDPAVPRRDVLLALKDSFGQFVNGPNPQTDIRKLDLISTALLGAAAAVVFLAVAALAHALASTVRTRRRDLATLRALGFTKGQVSTAVGWDSTIVAAIAVVLGAPVGVLIARLTWRAVEQRLGVDAPPTTPLLLVVAAAVGALVVANIVTVIPARRAARPRPAVALRAE